MPMIEIWDEPTIQLADLLEHVSVRTLDWAILQMWAVALDSETDVVSLEQRAAESPTGLALSGEQLRHLAAGLLQMIDGVVAGYRGRPPSRSDADLRSSAEIILEAVDSAFWRIYARDQDIIDRMRRAYVDVRDVIPTAPVPPFHDLS